MLGPQPPARPFQCIPVGAAFPGESLELFEVVALKLFLVLQFSVPGLGEPMFFASKSAKPAASLQPLSPFSAQDPEGGQLFWRIR